MNKKYVIGDDMSKDDLLHRLESLKDEANYMFRTSHDYIFKLDLIALNQCIKITGQLDLKKTK